MKKIIFITILLLSILADPIQAINFNTTCLNSNLLYSEATFNQFIDGAETEHIINQTITCRYGCENGICIDEETDFMIGITIVLCLGIVSFVFAYLGMNISPEKHGMMQFFFIALSLSFLSINVYNIYQIVSVAGFSSVSNILLTVFFALLIATGFFMAYSIITWLFNMIMSLKEKKES